MTSITKRRSSRCVGIVGGLGVGATVHYYERITAACSALGVIPDLVFVHADTSVLLGHICLADTIKLANLPILQMNSVTH